MYGASASSDAKLGYRYHFNWGFLLHIFRPPLLRKAHPQRNYPAAQVFPAAGRLQRAVRKFGDHAQGFVEINHHDQMARAGTLNCAP